MLTLTGFRAKINSIMSKVGPKLEKKFGVALMYSSRGTAAYQVYGIPWAFEKSLQEMVRLKVQRSTRNFTIHAQGTGSTAFPPTATNIAVNDTLYNPEDQIVYQITKVNNPDSVQSEWLIETVFDIPRQGGDVN